MKQLLNLITSKLDPAMGYRSRIHGVMGYFPSTREAPVYIKREDELSAGVIGTKWRKYLSLLPELVQLQCRQAILIGSAHSNNLLGLTQLLKERGITPQLLFKHPGDSTPRGNLLWLKMLLPQENLHPVRSSEWQRVDQLARELAADLPKDSNPIVIAEGGDHPAVLPGILTLALDIARNEDESGIAFQDIWTDSGTGVSAIGLALGLRLLGLSHKRLNITLIAGSPEEFLQRYIRFEQLTEKTLGLSLEHPSPELRFFTPASAPSFGSVNKTVLDETRRIARELGLLVDPVYSAKHFLTVKREMERNRPDTPQLVLFNGGPLGLCGFQERFAENL
jgi:1-aminocyclopropane-1-carboxylate deaminase